MKAIKTFYIGAFVTLLSAAQLSVDHSPIRFVGIGIGMFFVVFGWKVGWTANRGFTALIGHLAMTAGCLITAYGYCMITHSYCSCAMRMHDECNRSNR